MGNYHTEKIAKLEEETGRKYEWHPKRGFTPTSGEGSSPDYHPGAANAVPAGEPVGYQGPKGHYSNLWGMRPARDEDFTPEAMAIIERQRVEVEMAKAAGQAELAEWRRKRGVADVKFLEPQKVAKGGGK